MNNKVKKVLSYIGVACLGALIGMGALIGVSSCSKQDNQQQLKVKVNKKSLEQFEYTAPLFVFKGRDYALATYDQNHCGAIYLEQNILQSDLSNYMVYFNYQGQFALSDKPNDIYNRIQFGLLLNKVDNNTMNVTCSYIMVAQGNASNRDIYSRGNSTLKTPYLVKAVLSSSNSSDGFYYLSENYLGGVLDFYFYSIDNVELVDFNFAKQINYNAPYGWDISSTFINDSYFDSSHSVKVVTYDLPYFVSGGFVFNQIKVYFNNAMATGFIDTEGNRQVFNSYSFCYYQQMEYVNTEVVFSQVVNKRDMLAWSSGNDSGYSITRSSNWVSSDFKKLTFLSPLSPQQRLDVNQFNNNQYGDSFSVLQNNDVGLGNVFSLLTLAFSSWLPILSIQIVPGITLGLLMFIPLIAGIIILVIWIVKR